MTTYIKNLSDRAFSIVEITIVLIILGVLVTGSTAGFHLIQRSKLQSITTDFSEIKNAITAFSMTYHGLPGDLPYTDGLFSAAIVTKCGVGDGNGLIEAKDTDNGEGTALETYESVCAWAYLEDAKTLSGHLSQRYSGGFTGATALQLNVDIPASKFSGAGYFLNARSGYNFIELGKIDATDKDATPHGALTSKQAKTIASKVGSYISANEMFDTSGDLVAMNAPATIAANVVSAETTGCVAIATKNLANLDDDTEIKCIISSAISQV